MLFHHHTPIRILRSTNQLHIDFPLFSIEFGRRLFSYLASTVRNKLPLNVRFSPTTDIFKCRLNTHLFKQPVNTIQCCPPSDWQDIRFSIIAECAHIINDCIITGFKKTVVCSQWVLLGFFLFQCAVLDAIHIK